MGNNILNFLSLICLVSMIVWLPAIILYLNREKTFDGKEMGTKYIKDTLGWTDNRKVVLDTTDHWHAYRTGKISKEELYKRIGKSE